MTEITSSLDIPYTEWSVNKLVLWIEELERILEECDYSPVTGQYGMSWESLRKETANELDRYRKGFKNDMVDFN